MLNKVKKVMIKETKGVIYIPDISGFSKFANETDIEHGQKIISELIEEIIVSDQLYCNL